MSIISFVKYIASWAQNAGAIPADTVVATHERSEDGASVQDVFIDPANTVTITREDNLYNDAFQRQRVSNTDQRFDGDFSYDLSPLLFDNISATGTLTFNANTRDVTLATASTSAAVSAGLRRS